MNQPTIEKPKASESVEAIANLARIAAGAQKNTLANGRPFVILKGRTGDEEVEYLTEPDLPDRFRGTVKLNDAESFARYVAEEKMAPDYRTRIYCTLDPARLIAVLNDHGDSPSYRDFRAVFTLTQSREWRMWTGMDRKPISQIQFAEHIEDNLPDFVKPAGADMLEMSLAFEVTKNAAFKSVQRLQDGSVDFAWSEQGADAGKVRVPKEFTISIPVFENGADYELSARLKYRIVEDRLSIWYELIRPHKVLESAVKEVLSHVEQTTGIKPLFGMPE